MPRVLLSAGRMRLSMPKAWVDGLGLETTPTLDLRLDPSGVLAVAVEDVRGAVVEAKVAVVSVPDAPRVERARMVLEEMQRAMLERARALAAADDVSRELGGPLALSPVEVIEGRASRVGEAPGAGRGVQLVDGAQPGAPGDAAVVEQEAEPGPGDEPRGAQDGRRPGGRRGGRTARPPHLNLVSRKPPEK